MESLTKKKLWQRIFTRAGEQPIFPFMHHMEMSAGIFQTSKWKKLEVSFLKYNKSQIIGPSPYVVEYTGTDWLCLYNIITVRETLVELKAKLFIKNSFRDI